MPVLASAPEPVVPSLAQRRAISPPPPATLPIVGRSLAEYVTSFALDLPALRHRDVLDVGAGASSFVAEACTRKINAVGVDPLYGSTVETLATHIQLDFAQLSTAMQANPRLFRTPHFVTVADAEADRRNAAQRFLSDYDTHFVHGRYVGSALPRLPFFDGTFDLVLCGDLLFTATRFDPDAVLAALKELARIAADEVRIHPLCSPDGKPFPGLARLRRELKESGIASELRAVDSSYHAAAAQTLVLRRANS